MSTFADIDVAELSGMHLGEVASRGSDSEFRSLGQLSVSGTKQWVGIKGPRFPHSDGRLVDEVAFIDFCTAVSPELAPMVPSFMGIIAVENSKARAILTEDASRNNALPVRQRPASERVCQLLYRPFQDLGPMYSVVNAEALSDSLAFDVGGQERLLDFTPEPMGRGKSRLTPLKDGFETTAASLPMLEITLPQDSPLGRELHAQYGALSYFSSFSSGFF